MRALILLFFVAVAAAQAPPEMIKVAQTACPSAIKSKLKDPDSAKMELPGAGMWHEESWYFFLRVNAKNGFGGYTGGKPWICRLDRTGAVIEVAP